MELNVDKYLLDSLLRDRIHIIKQQANCDKRLSVSSGFYQTDEILLKAIYDKLVDIDAELKILNITNQYEREKNEVERS